MAKKLDYRPMFGPWESELSYKLLEGNAAYKDFFNISESLVYDIALRLEEFGGDLEKFKQSLIDFVDRNEYSNAEERVKKFVDCAWYIQYSHSRWRNCIYWARKQRGLLVDDTTGFNNDY